ncbi:hypothetical protein B0A50_03535 [Salinomyces thailandicus]|uniref:ATP-dependent DNA ligase family profile domain-containing protein n=1 Tax=Salinomyces thailandicus TaxID=706561 RepID=A0A4U0U4R5_9PEZI|nr:hypothetical protein B0A50_03535 [Salinomyces thailandica]
MLFSRVAALLSQLEGIETHDPPLLPRIKDEAARGLVERWFKSNRQAIRELEVTGGVALLSTLLPEFRTDRVYGLQAPTLGRMLSRSLCLSATRTKDLQAYREPGRGDLGQCVERVLKGGGPPATPAVTVVEIDQVLLSLAEQCHFSDPTITANAPRSSSRDKDELIGRLLKRMSPIEAKWLVRLILKDFSPVTVDDKAVLRSYHFLLPDLLRFQNDFEAGLRLLQEPKLRDIPPQPDRRSESGYRAHAASAVQPVVGVKVGRPDFRKAWSIEHCLNMLGSHQWVLERKYDGEYCEIHIDMSLSRDPGKCIKIFSKSGKDSTQDRRKIHQTLVECLRLGQTDCKIKSRAILLGELVVYSDKEHRVLPFDQIRKHVWRSGVSLGTEADSPTGTHEHLAIVFYDLLLWDDEVVLIRPIEERRQWLREIYSKLQGRAMSSEWKIVDFSDTKRARNMLIQQFAASIAQRCEGLVLKPCNVPYFSLGSSPPDEPRTFIKLKKDYMAGFGDDGDYAVIGASYHAQRALDAGVSGLKWTDFHLGCLLNTDEVLRFNARPSYQLVGTVTSHACIPKPILKALNTFGAPLATITGADAGYDIKTDNHVRIDATFIIPFVLEVLGSGYDKPSNCAFYMLRHARGKKLHQDRSWRDCITFAELQEKALAARNHPSESESQETRKWLAKIEEKLKRRLDRDGTLTPRSRKIATPIVVHSERTSATNGTTVSRSHPSPTDRSLRGTFRKNELEGSTLVEKQTHHIARSLKRTAGTPCPAPKRHCVTGLDKSHNHIASGKHFCAVPKAYPLVDITNQTSSHLGAQENSALQDPPVKGFNRQNTPTLQPAFFPTPPSSAGCTGARCPFADSVVHIAPCVSSMPYITQDLLGSHSAVIASSLQHWNRDSNAYKPMTETVSESQSHVGLRKLVLVESKRVTGTRDVVQQVLSLNQGRLKERIEVYDWRMLERCVEHEMSHQELKRFQIGATMFNQGTKRTMFVTTIPHFVVDYESGGET